MLECSDYRLTPNAFLQFSFSGIFNSIQSVFAGNTSRRGSHDFMEKLIATGKPIDEMANSILSVLVVATVELSQGKALSFSLRRA